MYLVVVFLVVVGFGFCWVVYGGGFGVGIFFVVWFGVGVVGLCVVLGGKLVGGLDVKRCFLDGMIIFGMERFGWRYKFDVWVCWYV